VGFLKIILLFRILCRFIVFVNVSFSLCSLSLNNEMPTITHMNAVPDIYILRFRPIIFVNHCQMIPCAAFCMRLC